MKLKFFPLLILSTMCLACIRAPRTLTILCTDDVHGAWFDSTYTGGKTVNSLMAVNYYVDSVRRADGGKNVLLLDAGDCLQGDNASFYYNYVDTAGEHLYSRLAAYMRYDAIAVGNHDIEPGPAVYRKVERELASHGIVFLAGNAVRDDGSPAFQVHKVFRRAGMKVLVLGYTNPNIPLWLDKDLWPDFHFESLIPLVQKDVDNLRELIKPDVTVVVAHSGTGKGDGKVLEDQSLDLYKSLRGVDFVICGHDHRQYTVCNDSIALINTGHKARFLGIGKITMGAGGSKALESSLIKVDKNKADQAMCKAFREDFEKVRAFSLQPVGMLLEDLYSRDAYKGPCHYTDLLHRIQLETSGAQISFAAPLKYNGVIPAGMISCIDMNTIYPYENQLYVLKLSGREIKNYLEYSYGRWLAAPGGPHALAIRNNPDPRYGSGRWSFVNAFYNFDTAAGISYTVDLRKPEGSRVSISSLGNGEPFRYDEYYTVAMTSYRANGGGYLLINGAGIPKDELASRTLARYREIRILIKEYIEKEGVLDPDTFRTPAMGNWKFIPDDGAIRKDLALLF